MNSAASQRLMILFLFLFAQVGIGVFGGAAPLGVPDSPAEIPQDSNSRTEADPEENEDDTTLAHQTSEGNEPLAEKKGTFTHEPGCDPALSVDHTSRAPPHAAL